jgi:hypothetical protein
MKNVYFSKFSSFFPYLFQSYDQNILSSFFYLSGKYILKRKAYKFNSRSSWRGISRAVIGKGFGK